MTSGTTLDCEAQKCLSMEVVYNALAASRSTPAHTSSSPNIAPMVGVKRITLLLHPIISSNNSCPIPSQTTAFASTSCLAPMLHAEDSKDISDKLSWIIESGCWIFVTGERPSGNLYNIRFNLAISHFPCYVGLASPPGRSHPPLPFSSA